jgi:hypothetical protein
VDGERDAGKERPEPRELHPDDVAAERQNARAGRAERGGRLEGRRLHRVASKQLDACLQLGDHSRGGCGARRVGRCEGQVGGGQTCGRRAAFGAGADGQDQLVPGVHDDLGGVAVAGGAGLAGIANEDRTAEFDIEGVEGGTRRRNAPQRLQHGEGAVDDLTAEMRLPGEFGIDVEGVAVGRPNREPLHILSGKPHE